VSDTSATAADSLAGLSDAEIRAQIVEQYPAFAPWFDSGDDEVANVIIRGFKEGRSQEWVQTNVMATNWWKTTNEPARLWETELRTDPEEAKRKLYAQIARIDGMLRRQGVNPDQARLWRMADQAIRFGWDDTAIQRAVGLEVRISTRGGALPAGEAAADADRLMAMAHDYHIPMARQTAEEWALKMLDGTSSQERFTSYVTQLARGRYGYDPIVLQGLDNGLTVEEIFAPHRQEIAGTLEINPNEIDFLNPKWGAVTEFVDDKGARRSMTLSEVGRWARGQEAYKKTDQANEQGAQLADSLLRTFGEIA
jgi:hypothetical protein